MTPPTPDVQAARAWLRERASSDNRIVGFDLEPYILDNSEEGIGRLLADYAARVLATAPPAVPGDVRALAEEARSFLATPTPGAWIDTPVGAFSVRARTLIARLLDAPSPAPTHIVDLRHGDDHSQAMCRCGWTGARRFEVARALSDADEHRRACLPPPAPKEPAK